MFVLLGIMLDWRLTLYLKDEPVALFNLHHYMGLTEMVCREGRALGRFWDLEEDIGRRKFKNR